MSAGIVIGPRSLGELRVAEAARRPPTSRNDGLDLLRAVGAFLVFGTHLWHNFGQTWLGPIADAGHLGVYIFFPLSGYLLSRPFFAGPVDLGRYARLRVARIVPAYYALVAVLFLANPGPLPWTELTFTVNVFPDAVRLNVGVAWTLGVEVAFYILLPLFVRGPWLLLGVASYLLAMLVPMEHWGFMQLPALYWSFAAGMVVARYRLRLARAWPLGVVLLGIGLIGPPGVLRADAAVTLGTAVLIAGVAECRPVIGWARVPANISYAVFLWHPVVIAALLPLDGPALVIASLVGVCAVASVSWFLLERPVLAGVRRRDDERARTRRGVIGEGAADVHGLHDDRRRDSPTGNGGDALVAGRADA